MPGFNENFVIRGHLGPRIEEFRDALVQDALLEPHGRLQEAVSEEPEDPHFVLHDRDRASSLPDIEGGLDGA